MSSTKIQCILIRHPEKTGHVIVAENETLNSIRNQIKISPLKYNEHIIKEKQNEKWLGDLFSQKGLEQSVEDTVKERSGRVKITIFEINAILEEIRMQKIGGIRGTLDIWELAIIPMLLNNCDNG